MLVYLNIYLYWNIQPCKTSKPFDQSSLNLAHICIFPIQNIYTPLSLQLLLFTCETLNPGAEMFYKKCNWVSTLIKFVLFSQTYWSNSTKCFNWVISNNVHDIIHFIVPVIKICLLVECLIQMYHNLIKPRFSKVADN